MVKRKKLKAEKREDEKKKEIEKKKYGGTLSAQVVKSQVNQGYKKSPKK